MIMKFSCDKRHDAIRMFLSTAALAAVVGMIAPAAKANLTPLFSATFPASWNGTSTTVTDQSGAGNTSYQSGTATYTTTAVPPLAPGGTGSMALTGVGGIKVPSVTPSPALLNNPAVAAAGGFTYDIEFMWDGTDTSGTSGGTQKLIDYAGTESLQLVVPSGAATASLQGAFTDDSGNTTTAVSTTILPHVWYDATLTFGNTSSVSGDVDGTANLYLDGVLVSSAPAVKGTFGDSLDRPIGIGELGYGHVTSIVGLTGDIYDASVSLGVTPEPASTLLLLMGGSLLAARRRRA